MTYEIKIIIEGKFVYLFKDNKRLNGVDPLELDTNPQILSTSYTTITSKYKISSRDIQKVIDIFLNQLKIIGSEAKIISFFFWCWYLEEKKVSGVDNLINHFKTRKSADELLSCVFVAEIAKIFSDKNKVIINVKKKENGTDLIINDLMCECKIRLAYLDENNKQYNLPENEVKSLYHLASNEINKNIRNRVMEAFLNQNADIVFVDSTRTYLGFAHISKNIFENDQSLEEFPNLQKYMLIYRTKIDHKNLWHKVFISPEEFDKLKIKIKEQVVF